MYERDIPVIVKLIEETDCYDVNGITSAKQYKRMHRINDYLQQNNYDWKCKLDLQTGIISKKKEDENPNENKRFKNITGQTFGNLTALELLDSRYDEKGHLQRWYKVQCNLCNKIYELQDKGIINNKKGCIDCSHKPEDLTNQTFGKLTVLNRSEDKVYSSGKTEVSWNVRCECGKEFPITTSNLKRNKGGCRECTRYFDDLTGQKFGKLTVVERGENYIDKDGASHIRWWCKCDCGNPKLVLKRAHDLKEGKIVSCGCFQSEKARQLAKNNIKRNHYDLSGEYGIGWTNKGEPFFFDIEDYDTIKNFTWCIYNGYVVDRNMNSMHDVIMQQSTGLIVDHIHGNETRNDNRKCNLRIGTVQQNIFNREPTKANTSGVTGVYYDKTNDRWIARICYNYKDIHLGTFKEKEDAIKARLKAEDEYFGDWSYYNSNNDSYINPNNIYNKKYMEGA